MNGRRAAQGIRDVLEAEAQPSEAARHARTNGEASREVARWAHLAAGTSAIREGSRLERAFRDMYTGTQHAFISEETYIDSAQIHLGLEDALPGV